MQQWKIDADLPDKLKALGCIVELVTDDGAVIGVVPSPLDPAVYELLGPDISDEELARRLAPDAKTYSTAEVIAHLRSLS